MAKIKIVGEAVVITSGVTKDTIATLAKFKPNALKLIEGEGKEKETVFAIALGTTPAANKFGVTFNDVNTEGNAQVTLTMSGVKPEDRKQYVKDHFGYMLLNLNKLETQINGVAADTAAEFNAMDDSIEQA